MSEFRSFKKADLARVAKKVGLSVRTKDTKQSLLEKLEQFIEESPEQAKDLFLGDEEEVITLVEETNESESESESDSSEESVVADLPEDDEDDKDYDAPPPINLKEWLVDPAIEAFESGYASVLSLTDKVGMTTAAANDDLRDALSKTVTLNWAEAAVEVSYFLYYYVPLVAIKDNRSVHQVLRDNIPQLNSMDFPLPDVTALWNYGVMSIFANWLVYAVGLPLLVAYYINFSRRVVVIENLDDDEEELQFVARVHKYDPFIFALAKVLIFYFIFKNGALTSIDSYKGIFQALRNHLFIQLGIYHTFVVSLGNFPLVVGAANVIVGLYSQFEDC